MKVNNPLPKDIVAIAKAKKLYGNVKRIKWIESPHWIHFPLNKEYKYYESEEMNSAFTRVEAIDINGHNKSLMYVNGRKPLEIEYY